MTTPAPRRIAGLAIAAAIVASACGGSGAATAQPSNGTTAPSAPETQPATGAAGIVVSGSSTVEPISTAVAEAYAAANPGFAYTIEGPGTGDGFKKFCNGETDISDASRKIKDEEAKACADAGIAYVELKVAYDGISVLTSTQGTPIACLSFADLYALVGPESTGFATWADAKTLATELGSTTTYPDTDLSITGPGEESGTFDSFVELALDAIGKERGQIPDGQKHTTTRPDYTASPNDNAIIDGIAGAPGTLGWVGFAYAEENKDKVAEIAISKTPGGACVALSAETISDGSYPLARSLYLYVNTAKAKANPAVAAYVDYYLAEGTIATALETVPYVSLPADELEATRAAWEASKQP